MFWRTKQGHILTCIDRASQRIASGHWLSVFSMLDTVRMTLLSEAGREFILIVLLGLLEMPANGSSLPCLDNSSNNIRFIVLQRYIGANRLWDGSCYS